MNCVRKSFSTGGAPAARQRGVILIITLIVLIAMTLAAIALVRSVDTGGVVAGNMAFKQGATQAGDAGAQTAVNWLQTIAGQPASYNDDAGNGYYATYNYSSSLDVSGTGSDPARYLVDWDNNGCNGQAQDSLHCLNPAPTTTDVGAGYQAKYIINRLCSTTGQISQMNQSCATTSSQVGGTSSGLLDYTGKGGLSGSVQVEFYRIATRVTGPHNTVSYLETIVHF